MAHRKQKKKVHRHQLRNAAPMRAPTMRAPRPNGVAPSNQNTPVDSQKKTSWGLDTLKTAGGAAGAAVTCALLARENVFPPVFITGLVTGVGATMAVFGRNDTLRQVGAGAMSAAGAQLGLMLIDNHYDDVETQKRIAAAQADKAAAERAHAEKAKADLAKATRSAESLPPGALEAAYERARARLAMAQAASHMAPA